MIRLGNELAVFENQVQLLAPQFDQVLASPGVNLTSVRLIRSVLISCERTPTLLACSRQSLINAAMSAACLGLECDGVTGQAFIIPFKNRAQLVVGYKGYNTLAARSGITITGEAVRVGDAFDFDEGEGWVTHKKLLSPGERAMLAVWAKAAASGRPPVVKIMSLSDVLAVKGRSPGAKREESPWNDHVIGFTAMAEKSVKRRLARALPLNVMTSAAIMDEAFEERGLHSYISPTKGVQTEELTADQPRALELTASEIDAPPQPSGEPTLSDRLISYDALLTAASLNGTAALQAEWANIPYEYRVNLKSALDRRHKPTATEADNGAKATS